MDNLEVWVSVLVIYGVFTLLWLVVAVIIDVWKWLDGYLEEKEDDS